MNRQLQQWGLDLPGLKAAEDSARLAVPVRLIILHYHLRPGGIRRIIELATPFLLREIKEINTVVLATGEPAAESWLKSYLRSLTPANLQLFVNSAFGYFSEQK